jgi:hypothetical protein
MSKWHVVLAVSAVVLALSAVLALAIAIPAFAGKPATKGGVAYNTVAADGAAVDIASSGGFTLRLNNPAGGEPNPALNCIAQIRGDGQAGLAFQSVNYGGPTPMNVPEGSFGNTDTLLNQTGAVTIGQLDNTGTAQFEFYIFDIGNGSCVIRGTALGDTGA